MPKRMLLGALAALAITSATASPAAAQGTTVSGCYGAVVIVCDPTVTGAETYKTTVEVCTGTCRDVELTLVKTDSDVCVRYTTRSGTQQDVCAARSYSYSDYYYSENGTCSGARTDPLEEEICIRSYNDYYSSNSETCVGVYGDVRQSYCF